MGGRASGTFLYPIIRDRCAEGRGRPDRLLHPRVMIRSLAQMLTEEYSDHGIHVASVIID
jgi:hypothetical protein